MFRLVLGAIFQGRCRPLNSSVHSRSPVGLWQEFRADADAHFERPVSVLRSVGGALLVRSVQAASLYRLSRWAHLHRLRPIAAVLCRVSQLLFQVDIDPRAVIGPGLRLRHCQGVVIGSEAVIGNNCTIFHQVTIGKRFSGGPDRPDGMATIGDHVLIGAGAKILGPVSIASHAVIGANVVVTRDVPAVSEPRSSL